MPIFPRRSALALLLPLVMTTSMTTTEACTDFRLKSRDGAVVVGRSLEFALELRSRIHLYRPDQSDAGARYAYIGVDALGLPFITDGMNEKGLSAGFLWMPGSRYETAGSGKESVEISKLGAWILSRFASVDEARKGLESISVTDSFIEEMKMVPPLHLSLHDASGESLVVEFIDGKKRIYQNPCGVMTNAPTFDWHITNLRNYLNLSAGNAEPIRIKGTVLAPPGQGSGFLGIPGDWTPPSRFVRTAAMIRYAETPENPSEAVNLAEHILNAVDIPRGDIRDESGSMDYTQWAVIKDLKNRKFYFRSYRDIAIKVVHFDEALRKNYAGYLPIAADEPPVDATAGLAAAK